LTGIYNHASFYARQKRRWRGRIGRRDDLRCQGLRTSTTPPVTSPATVLRRVAMALELETRPDDLVARWRR
jgi:hypothetical protein